MPKKPKQPAPDAATKAAGKPSPVVDTRVIWCGDNVDNLEGTSPETHY